MPPSHPEDFAAQTHNIWKTIGETLAQADASLDDLVRATIYLTEAADACDGPADLGSIWGGRRGRLGELP